MKDSFSEPLSIRPGCQHQLGCRCEVPYYLRPSTPVERRKELRRPVLSEKETFYREMLLEVLQRTIPMTLRRQIIEVINKD